jgi:hypothetical protein
MTMPDADIPSKPRRRIGLWAPYVAVALAFAAWSLFWLVLKGQIEDRIDRESANLRTSGYEASWKARQVSGYPFRFEVELTDARIAEPSGWGVAASSLKAVAAAYRIDHWVFVAPDGLTLSRPTAGEVQVTAEVLRASIADAGKAPRISFEGRKLAFQPQRGADAFPFTAANLVEFHLRPQDGDRSEMLWRMEGAQTRRTGFFAQIAPLAPLSFRLSGELSDRSKFTGRDWTDAVRNWTEAGGSANIKQMLASVGDVSLSAKGGPLTVAYDGRLRGDLNITLRQGAAALAALGASQTRRRRWRRRAATASAPIFASSSKRA